MRVLALANRLDARGGLERTQLTNCRGLAGRGHQLGLVYVDGGAFEAEWEAFSAWAARVPATLPRRRRALTSSWSVAAGVRAARRWRPDVVYVYRYWDLPFAAAVAAGSPTAVVFHLCLPPPEPVPRVLRAALGRVDHTVSVSADTLTRWRGTGLATERATVALTSLDLAAYAPGSEAGRRATRAELGLDPAAFMVLFAGRLTADKGVDVAVRAFAELCAQHPDSALVVVGSPPDDPIGRAYADQLRRLAGDRPVTWLDRRPDVVSLLQAADVTVLPSRWPEPLARGLLEALGCGIPVVATRVGGSPEVLTGWLADWLVDPDDPAALAGALGALYGWRDREPELGARCRAAAEQRPTLDDELDLIVSAMAEARRRAGSRRHPRRHQVGHVAHGE